MSFTPPTQEEQESFALAVRDTISTFSLIPAARRIPDANPMTPRRIGTYQFKPGQIVEISIGHFMGDMMGGITFDPDPNERSSAFHTLKEMVSILEKANEPSTDQRSAPAHRSRQ